MARRCGPNKQKCGMSQGLFNPFFQNGAPWYGSGGGGEAWVLSTGIWNDNEYWDDSAFYKD